MIDATSTSAETVGYLLYDFAPFLSVAMAINFVSSFWDAIKNKAIDNLDVNTEELVAELNAIYTSGNCGNSETVKNMRASADKPKKVLKILSATSTSLGILIVVAIFVLLAYIGFFPKYTLSLTQACLMITLSLFPSTILRLIGIWYSHSKVKAMTDNCETIKQSAKDALKDNEQAAYAQASAE
ncbi:hypothetical protein AB8I88_002870 [Vibrio fluvialis]